jgi:hypothetical protein
LSYVEKLRLQDECANWCNMLETQGMWYAPILSVQYQQRLGRSLECLLVTMYEDSTFQYIMTISSPYPTLVQRELLRPFTSNVILNLNTFPITQWRHYERKS